MRVIIGWLTKMTMIIILKMYDVDGLGMVIIVDEALSYFVLYSKTQ